MEEDMSSSIIKMDFGDRIQDYFFHLRGFSRVLELQLPSGLIILVYKQSKSSKVRVIFKQDGLQYERWGGWDRDFPFWEEFESDRWNQIFSFCNGELSRLPIGYRSIDEIWFAKFGDDGHSRLTKSDFIEVHARVKQFLTKAG